MSSRCSKKYLWQWTWIAGIALTLFAVFAWGYFDTYTERWTKDTASYNDTYHFWSGKHVYRRYSTSDKAMGYSLTAYGPIAGHRKPHGEWTYVYWEPEFDSITKFFWYGEEITEGQWHLRN